MTLQTCIGMSSKKYRICGILIKNKNLAGFVAGAHKTREVYFARKMFLLNYQLLRL